MVTRLLVGCFFVISSTFVQASDILFVSSRLAPVYAQANLGSRILTRLTRNTEIEVVSPKGIWLQIIYDGKQGWISRYSVTANSPPENKVSIFDRLKSHFDRCTCVLI